MSNIRSKQELREGGVTLLGNQNTRYSDDYDPTVLQTFENKHPDNDYVVSFDAYEFTSHCIVGSTMIDVATDETSNPEGIPIEQLVGTGGYVYGVDPDTLEPVCRKYRDVRKTQSNVPVVRVVMDKIIGPYNNRKHSIESIVCTPDHQFLVKRGFKDAKWVAANELTPDMHLIGSQLSSVELPSLNPKVIRVEDAGNSDVYNMEVEDVHNFFANGVIVHNCPITGQPDFAKVVISYIPNKMMVESKSLKLYLFSFRNHGDFHEDCMNIVMKDLIKLMNPKYIEVRGIFSPRGGISIFPFVNWANPEFDFSDYAKQRQLDALRDASNRTARYDM